MKEIQKNILHNKIIKVIYSEVNHHNGKFHFEGFDTFDHSINIQMENEYWWNLSWKNNEYFELGEGFFNQNKYISLKEIKSWEATERWSVVLDTNISGFKINYIDDAKLIIDRIILKFENGEKINILIAPKLNQNEIISYPLKYELCGEIYVFHQEKLLDNEKTVSHNSNTIP